MYPDGCTQFHIDYAAGGYDDKEEEMIGEDLSLAESIAFLDSTDDYAWPAVKAELVRLQTALDEVVAEYHAAINEPVYAGTRLDWMHRCQAAERDALFYRTAVEKVNPVCMTPIDDFCIYCDAEHGDPIYPQKGYVNKNMIHKRTCPYVVANQLQPISGDYEQNT